MNKNPKQNKIIIYKQKFSNSFKKISCNLKIIILLFLFFISIIIVRGIHLRKQEKQKNKYDIVQSISYQLMPLTIVDYEIPSTFYVEKKENLSEIYFKFYFVQESYIRSLIIRNNNNVVINYRIASGTRPLIVMIGTVKDHATSNFKNMRYIIYVPFGAILTENYKRVFQLKLKEKAFRNSNNE